jgi:hypothetical protein
MGRSATLRKANDDVIRKAFARMTATKDEVIRGAMYNLLESAVQIALEAHDEKHSAHIELGDTYGWMLVHNHRIEEIAVVATSNNEGQATKQLQEILRSLPPKGWVGVVMAGLEPADYFSVRYELGILDYSFQITRQNFFEYFTKI